MRKSTIFISAVLTTFALAMLYGVVSAYRGILASTEVAAQPTPADVSNVVLDTPAPTQSAITPEQAAQVAAQVLGRTDLLSAESASINGLNAYKITFVSGYIVYVGLDGQILSVQQAPAVVASNNTPSQPARKARKDRGGGDSGGGGESGGGEHEGHDD